MKELFLSIYRLIHYKEGIRYVGCKGGVSYFIFTVEGDRKTKFGEI